MVRAQPQNRFSPLRSYRSLSSETVESRGYGMYYIYGLLDPLEGEIRYVGKCTNPTGRLRAHIKERGNTRKCNWIATLCAQGREPVLLILEEGEGAWQERERRWIAAFRMLGNDLCNHTDGGEGLVNPSPETRLKIAEARRRIWEEDRQGQLEIIQNPVRCAKISTALKGRAKSAAHVANLPQNRRGVKRSEEHKAAISASLKGNTYRRGKKSSAETRLKISMSLTGRKQVGKKPPSKESNLKRSLTLKGRLKSPETIEKMRAAAQARWDRVKRRQEDADVEVRKAA